MDAFLEVLLVELRARGYRADRSFEVLMTITSVRGQFGLRYNPRARRRVVVSSVDGLEWSRLVERELTDACQAGDREFVTWLVGLIGPSAGGER